MIWHHSWVECRNWTSMWCVVYALSKILSEIYGTWAVLLRLLGLTVLCSLVCLGNLIVFTWDYDRPLSILEEGFLVIETNFVHHQSWCISFWASGSRIRHNRGRMSSTQWHLSSWLDLFALSIQFLCRTALLSIFNMPTPYTLLHFNLALIEDS